MVDFILKREGAEGPWYVSDPETKYKCTEGTYGSWYCERLDKTIQNPKRRFIMTCSVKDHTGSQLVSLFDDQAVQLLGHTADEIFDMQVSGQEARAEAIYKQALFTECYLSLRVKMETYNDEARQKVVVTGMAPVNFEQECAQLTAAINAFP
jgi:replication factor A1